MGAILSSPKCGARANDAVTVGDPSNPAALGQSVQEAYATGARRIVIRPGTYIVPGSGKDIVRLEGWKDATLSAYHVTIISTGQSWPNAIFHIDRCTNVTVTGPLLSQIEVTMYQGKVTATGKDAGGEFYCDWTPDAGYPIMPIDAAKRPSLNVIDAHTRKLKLGVGDFYAAKWTSLGNNAFRITGFGKSPNIEVGDWLVARRETPTAIKVHLDNSENCTVKDVSMMRNGFAPIFETGGAGGNHIIGCKWLLGPKPDGAAEEPLISTMADGFHSSGTVKGPDIENCVMEGVFLDDNFAIHGSFTDVVSSSGNKIVVKRRGADFVIGEPVIVCDKNGFFAQATVSAREYNVDGSGTVTITTDKALDVPADAKAYNPDACGAGFKIVNCRLGDTRSRGILVKGNDGLIQGNTILRCGMSAVSIGPEFYWGEAGYVRHVVVSGNKIVECGHAGYGGGAILVHGDGSVGNSDITIKNNRMSSSYHGDIQVEWSSGVVIAGNEFAGADAWPSNISAHSVIMLANARDIVLDSNIVKNATSYKTPLVAVGGSVSGLTHNDESGIRVKK